MKKTKRMLASVLVIVMILSMVMVPTYADSITSLSSATVEINGSAAKTVTLNWTVNATDYVWSFQVDEPGAPNGDLTTSLADGKITLTAIAFGAKLPVVNDYCYLNGYITWEDQDEGANLTAGDTLVSLTYTVAADTPAGTYPVVLNYQSYEDDSNGADNTGTVTATIEVTEPSAAPDYELYYTLDAAADTDADRYIEYNPGDTVTATFYMKAKADDVLQAVDFYVTNDANLEYKSMTSPIGAVRVASGTNQSTETRQHIQVIGSSKESPINVDMTAGSAVAIATVVYQVKNSAVYNTAMPITIENTANFAVENTPESFTPAIQVVSSTTLGVETLKTYTVSYNDNVESETITVPDAQTKQHNVALTLSDTAPVRTGYIFKGWSKTEGKVYSADSDVDYAAGASFAENADTVLYALWEPDIVEYTVEHYQQNLNDNGYTIVSADTQTLTGTTGTQTEAVAKTYTGFTAQPITQQTIAADGSTVVRVYYDRNTYTVTWKNDNDAETVLESDTSVRYGATPSYDSETPQKEADAQYTYSHDGWSATKGGTKLDTLPAVTENVTYWAHYSTTVNKYDVTFDKQGHGTETVPSYTGEEQLAYGEKVPNPGNLTETGWTFGGWYKEAACNNAWDFNSDTVAGTTVIYAKWTENTYTIHYNGNNNTSGTAPADQTDIPYTKTDLVLAEQGSLLRSGYSFQGWNTKADGTGVDFNGTVAMSTLEPYAVSGTVTLYAKWGTEDYTISYDYDGGALPVTEPATTNPAGYDVDHLPITLNRPVRAGYTFESWTIAVKSGENGNVVADGDQLKAGTWGNLTVKANWTPSEANFTVKYFQQNIDNDEYTEIPDDEQTITTGITGQLTSIVFTPAPDKYTGFHLSTLTGKNEPITILADGSAVLNIYYDRDVHTVSYAYTGTVPDGAPAVPATEAYKYGAAFTVAAAPTLTGYDFSGWSVTGSQTMGTEDVNITGSWSEHSYHIYFHTEGSIAVGASELVSGGDQTFTISNGTITEPAVPDKAENNAWYDKAWTAYSTTTLADQDAYPEYTKKTFTITFQDENDTDLTDQGEDNTFDIDDRGITPPAVPEKPGYTGSWPTDMTDTPGNKEVQPIYTPIEYTITFVPAGGTDIAVNTANGITAVNTMKYTIESAWTLPTATGKTNFSFQNWKVTTTDTEASWASNSVINGGTAVTGKYGNVTLTAQWTQALVYAVQEYKYAAAGYKMLIISDQGVGDGNVYKYNLGTDSEPIPATMYYTTDANYKIGAGTGVFFTLIPATELTLSDEQVSKIAAVSGEKETITYDGDVNGDGDVNIADANAVFQMVVATGSYYGEGQLTVAQRLAADMVKATANAEYRGSIEDVNAIVAIINGTN